jgi:hypothetical protein
VFDTAVSILQYRTQYNRLAEDKTSMLKYIEDIKNIKNYNIILEEVHFVGLYCIIILQSAVQKT